MSSGPTFHGIPLPAERNAALAYFDTYVRLAKQHLVRRHSPEQPYTRQDYIKEITAFFGERKDKIDWPFASKTGRRKASSSRFDGDVQEGG